MNYSSVLATRFPEMRTLTMPTRCLKCDSRWVRVEHCEGVPDACYEMFHRFPLVLEDHFHRWCEECTFAWMELSPDVDMALVLPRCEQCYALEDPDDELTRFVLPCQECATLLCRACTIDGCVGCSQIQDAMEILNAAGIVPAVVSGPVAWRALPGDRAAGDAGGVEGGADSEWDAPNLDGLEELGGVEDGRVEASEPADVGPTDGLPPVRESRVLSPPTAPTKVGTLPG